MKFFRNLFFITALAILSACGNVAQFFDAENPQIRYQGRIDFTNPSEPVLIGSASYVEFSFTGDSCSFFLKNNNPPETYSFISLELDGDYLGRIKISADTMAAYPLVAPNKGTSHRLRIFKATEAANGTISFGGAKVNGLTELQPLPERTMEFIGNSITCGMGIDWKEIPCHTGQWYDQHNAYLAYGPQCAMELDAQFMLSSVSGIGVYRNWNSPGPVMPDVYENRYLNTDNTKKWNFTTFTPDLVSIALGTNDFSDGDGQHERLPFDSAQYVNAYIHFVKTIYSHYPETQVCLLTSPMVHDEKAQTFEHCVTAVKNYFDENSPDKNPIAVYFFEGITPHGCDSHPDNEDQQTMADMLVPFYKNIMDWE